MTIIHQPGMPRKVHESGMKVCCRCSRALPVEQFGHDKSRPDGLRYSCRECRSTVTKDWRATNIEAVREIERARRAANPERSRQWARDANARRGERLREYRSRTWERDRQKRSARKKTRRAARHGRVERPTVCSWCGAEARVEAHHVDYSLPLEVTWLCRSCHATTWRKGGR
jgi:transposase-like protein